MYRCDSIRKKVSIFLGKWVLRMVHPQKLWNCVFVKVIQRKLLASFFENTVYIHYIQPFLMVSAGVLAIGTTSVHFVEPVVKVSGRYYRKVFLMLKLLPDIRKLSEFCVFRQDSSPTHGAHETRNTPDIICLTLWPPNSPHLNFLSTC